jgi:hypothetical protein
MDGKLVSQLITVIYTMIATPDAFVLESHILVEDFGNSDFVHMHMVIIDKMYNSFEYTLFNM